MTNLLEPAERFVLSHPDYGDLGRDTMVQQTMHHLQNQHECSLHTAGLFAIQAMANIESKGVDGYIDLDHSTTTCVFLRVGGQLRAVSIKELLQYVDIEVAA